MQEVAQFVGARQIGLQLAELAGAEIRIRMRMIATLYKLSDRRDARGAKQL